MRSKRDSDPRLLIGALVLSALLHGFILFADRVHFENRDRGRQIVIQASLRPPPDAATAPPERVPAGGVPAGRARAKEAASPAPEPGRGVPAAPGQRQSPAAPGDAGAQGREEDKGREAQRRDRAAVVLSDPGAPEYPDDAVTRKLESCVLAAVLVSASGDVQSVRILHADVAAVFDRSVIDAYSRARYLPAQSNGENLPSRVLAVASFVLTPERSRNCASRYASAARRINGMPVSAEIDPALVEAMLHGAR